MIVHYFTEDCCTDESINVAVEALHAAITLYSRSPEVNGEQLSRCYHSLVQLVMGSREETTAVRGEQGEGWNLFSQILDLLESKVKVSNGSVGSQDRVYQQKQLASYPAPFLI